MPKKLLVFQHVAHEILGTLDPLLRGSGFRIRYVNFGRHPDARPRLDGYHGLVVLGGPMNVGETDRHPHLATEMELIGEGLERGMPILGVCLGAQLVAATLGAPVGRGEKKEIGWYDVSPTDAAREDPLLGHLTQTEKIFQWHGDTFEVPDGAVHLATGSICPNQAFRYGDRVYGFQFHLEVDEPMIERWLRVPGNRQEIEELRGEIDPEVIRRETKRHVRRLHELSDSVFGEFIRLFGPRERAVVLPSGHA